MSATVRQPAEWEPHAAVWTAWPSHPRYWEGHIPSARSDVAGLLRALAGPAPGAPAPETLQVWADGDEALDSLHRAVPGLPADVARQPLGDIWFRDIAPIFVRGPGGALEYRIFRYNGWGGKYDMPHDATVAARIARATGLPGRAVPMVFEGGALDVDGAGLGLTTRCCLLNPNRNPELAERDIARLLETHLGVDTLVWLDDGLLNDHTDGHVDNLARFVAPRTVVCQHPCGPDDPNAAVLRATAAALLRFRTPSGARLEVIEVPSPGKVTGPDGAVLPASHMNFYIANHRVLVPVYGTPHEEAALAALQQLFPGRAVTGLPARGLLLGGGAFHCITQQQPVP